MHDIVRAVLCGSPCHHVSLAVCRYLMALTVQSSCRASKQDRRFKSRIAPQAGLYQCSICLSLRIQVPSFRRWDWGEVGARRVQVPFEEVLGSLGYIYLCSILLIFTLMHLSFMQYYMFLSSISVKGIRTKLDVRARDHRTSTGLTLSLLSLSVNRK